MKTTSPFDNAGNDWVSAVHMAIQESERAGTLVSNEILPGFSGLKLIGLLQRVARSIEQVPNVCYAEIGVFQGLTLLSVALAAPNLKVYGIDNYSQFDPEHKNKQLVLDRQQHLSLSNVQLIDRDYDEVLRSFPDLSAGEKIGLLFVDGPHDYRSQLLCVLLALPHLAENAIIVIDDCNYEHVRLATRDLLMIDPTIRLVFEVYTPGHPMNLGTEMEKEMRAGWWNGVHVLVRGPAAAKAKRFLPNIGKARERCEREHQLQPHAADVCSQELYDLAYDLAAAPTVSRIREAWRLLRHLRWKIRQECLFRTGNTYSSKIASQTIQATRNQSPTKE